MKTFIVNTPVFRIDPKTFKPCLDKVCDESFPIIQVETFDSDKTKPHITYWEFDEFDAMYIYRVQGDLEIGNDSRAFLTARFAFYKQK